MHREPGSAIVCLVVSSILFSRELIMHETRIVYVCLYVPTHRETKGGSRHGLHIGFHKLGMGGKANIQRSKMQQMGEMKITVCKKKKKKTKPHRGYNESSY